MLKEWSAVWVEFNEKYKTIWASGDVGPSKLRTLIIIYVIPYTTWSRKVKALSKDVHNNEEWHFPHTMSTATTTLQFLNVKYSDIILYSLY